MYYTNTKNIFTSLDVEDQATAAGSVPPQESLSSRRATGPKMESQASDTGNITI